MSEEKKIHPYIWRDDITPVGETAYIELRDGPYAGMVYRYTSISLDDEEEDKLSFNVEFYDAETDDTILKNEDFVQAIGDILVEDVIRAALKLLEEKEKNEDRTSDTEELDSQ